MFNDSKKNEPAWGLMHVVDFDQLFYPIDNVQTTELIEIPNITSTTNANDNSRVVSTFFVSKPKITGPLLPLLDLTLALVDRSDHVAEQLEMKM